MNLLQLFFAASLTTEIYYWSVMTIRSTPTGLLCVLACITQPAASFTGVSPRVSPLALRLSLLARTRSSTQQHDENYSSRRHRSLAAEHSDLTETNDDKQRLPTFLDPGTRGGALFLGLFLFVAPLLVYKVITTVGGVEEEAAGVAIWGGIHCCVNAWVGRVLVE
mmetsp:Transcript_17532/g.29101  ORF Transcript_17532/g.29101 Transcript_17532/m.29101 type:complete len:165 (-) Transcript_17532:70-564(-)